MDHHHHNMHEMHNHHGHASMEDSSSPSSSSHRLCGEDDMGMVMYMDGFHWTLAGDSNNNGGCLNLLVASWRLDTVPKFLMAMAGVVALGIATEGIRRWKHTVSQDIGGNNGNSRRRWFRTLQQTSLQGLGLLAAYLLMLVVMTYSYELLFSVVLGLMIGYFWFDNDDLLGGGGTPCCGSLLEGRAAASGNGSAQSANGVPMTEPLLPRSTTSTMVPSVEEENDAEHSCCHNDQTFGEGI